MDEELRNQTRPMHEKIVQYRVKPAHYLSRGRGHPKIIFCMWPDVSVLTNRLIEEEKPESLLCIYEIERNE